MARISDIPLETGKLWNPDSCPADLLPWLAWALSVDEWDSNWNEQTKRELIKASAIIHLKKGTIGAVKDALSAFGYESDIEEWWQHNGQPHTFKAKVLIDDRGIDNPLIQQIGATLNAKKRASSHYTLSLALSSEATNTVTAACCGATIATVEPYVIRELKSEGFIYCGVSTLTAPTAIVEAYSEL